MSANGRVFHLAERLKMARGRPDARNTPVNGLFLGKIGVAISCHSSLYVSARHIAAVVPQFANPPLDRRIFVYEPHVRRDL